MPSRFTRIVTALALAALVAPLVCAETLNGVPVEVLVRSVVAVPNGTVTYLRIRPPQLPPLPAEPATPAAAPTAEQLAAEERRAAKPCAELSVSGLVYVGTPTATELTWWKDGRQFRAWSNVDFRLLAPPDVLETETLVFAWTPTISEGATDGIPLESRPAGLSLFTPEDTAPEYFFEGTEADMAKVASTLAGLDYLHAYYQIHRARLAENHALREAEALEQTRLAAEAAARPRNEKIYFWKIQ